jgi:hypothetical protein
MGRGVYPNGEVLQVHFSRLPHLNSDFPLPHLCTQLSLSMAMNSNTPLSFCLVLMMGLRARAQAFDWTFPIVGVNNWTFANFDTVLVSWTPATTVIPEIFLNCSDNSGSNVFGHETGMPSLSVLPVREETENTERRWKLTTPHSHGHTIRTCLQPRNLQCELGRT